MEKVENVVKPPQKPTVSISAQLLLSLRFRLKYPQRVPIRKQPNRLAVIVGHGKFLLRFFINSEMVYLVAPPKKLPVPTSNMSFITLIVIAK